MERELLRNNEWNINERVFGFEKFSFDDFCSFLLREITVFFNFVLCIFFGVDFKVDSLSGTR